MAINSLSSALTISNADKASSNTNSKVGYKLSSQEMNKLSGREVEPTHQEDEAVKVQVETQTKMVMEIHTQIMSLSQSISDALKEAGISDPGVLMNVLV